MRANNTIFYNLHLCFIVKLVFIVTLFRIVNRKYSILTYCALVSTMRCSEDYRFTSFLNFYVYELLFLIYLQGNSLVFLILHLGVTDASATNCNKNVSMGIGFRFQIYNFQ